MHARIRLFYLVLALVSSGIVLGHGVVGAGTPTDRAIQFPDTDDYLTLVLDLHTHSVFSDGHVWPTIRVEEARRDGLDGLAITEHLEWQPHITDIPHPDRNRSFEEASRAAADLDLLVIPGIEITRNDAVGHMNAIFVKDANAMVRQRSDSKPLPEHLFGTRDAAVEFARSVPGGFGDAHEIDLDGKRVWLPFADSATYFTLVTYQHAVEQAPREVLEAANEQGAFTFWNHPSFAEPWAEPGEFHREVIESGLLHGVEVANGSRYYANAHRLALEHNLVLIGTSDVHNLIDWDYQPEAGGHRPVTLVFAESKTVEDIKKALFAHRTVVWWEETLIGRKPMLDALLGASVQVAQAAWRGSSTALRLVLVNHSDAPLLLDVPAGMKSASHAKLIRLEPQGETRVDLVLDERSAEVTLEFTVQNALVGPDTPASLSLSFTVAD